MNTSYQSRVRSKNVSFRGEDDDNDLHDSQQHRHNNHEDSSKFDCDESRMVKLLPDANMTISVRNDYRDPRGGGQRGARGILKGNTFRDDTNLDRHSNNSSSSYHPGRGFETGVGGGDERGRGRGSRRPRGYYEGGGGGGGRGRPLSGNYDYHSSGGGGNEGYQRSYGRERQASDSYEHGGPQRARQGGDGDYERGPGRGWRGGSGRPRRSRGGRARGGRGQRGGWTGAAPADDGGGAEQQSKEGEWLEHEDPVVVVEAGGAGAQGDEAGCAREDSGTREEHVEAAEAGAQERTEAEAQHSAEGGAAELEAQGDAAAEQVHSEAV